MVTQGDMLMSAQQPGGFRSLEFKDETKATAWRAKGYVVPRHANSEALGVNPASPLTADAPRRRVAGKPVADAIRTRRSSGEACGEAQGRW